MNSVLDSMVDSGTELVQVSAISIEASMGDSEMISNLVANSGFSGMVLQNLSLQHKQSESVNSVIVADNLVGKAAVEISDFCDNLNPITNSVNSVFKKVRVVNTVLSSMPGSFELNLLKSLIYEDDASGSRASCSVSSEVVYISETKFNRGLQGVDGLATRSVCRPCGNSNTNINSQNGCQIG